METEQVQCVYVCVCVCIVCVTRPGHGDPGRWSRHHHRAPAGSLSNNPYLLESTNGPYRYVSVVCVRSFTRLGLRFGASTLSQAEI